jgi:hypothetical protein
MKDFNTPAPEKIESKKRDFDDEDDYVEIREDYTIVDEDEDYDEPKGPRKEELKSNEFFLDDDDDDDEEF